MKHKKTPDTNAIGFEILYTNAVGNLALGMRFLVEKSHLNIVMNDAQGMRELQETLKPKVERFTAFVNVNGMPFGEPREEWGVRTAWVELVAREVTESVKRTVARVEAEKLEAQRQKELEDRRKRYQRFRPEGPEVKAEKEEKEELPLFVCELWGPRIEDKEEGGNE